MSGTVSFDARPLTDPVDPRAVAAFDQQLKQMAAPTSAGRTIAYVILVVVGIFAIAPILLVFAAIATIPSSGFLGSIGSTVFFLFIVGLAVGLVLLIVAQRRRARIQRFRIAQFAFANRMTYVPRVEDPPLPGMIFHQGSGRYASDAVRGSRPRFVEFGNYQYTTGSGKNQTTHRWGYVAVKLDVPLPNIVLDALGNNTLGTNLPASFGKRQRLSLEGDFDRYFALYCPEGYERDALYLFTPDVMARFIDHAAQLDVEIVDDWLFFYLQRPASTLDPATWAWLFGAVGAMMTKFEQWARWRDDHLPVAAPAPAGPPAPFPAGATPAAPGPVGQPVPGALPFVAPVGMLRPPPGVAPQGRRLKRSVSWVSIILIAVIFGFTLLPTLVPILIGIFSFR
ncbi:hypothetical protein [Microbacterium sp.]|uniref:hypothetical protein n=1 Tax=Microbacterium sp. TaxID=51671 RepID=UPI003341EBDA